MQKPNPTPARLFTKEQLIKILNDRLMDTSLSVGMEPRRIEFVGTFAGINITLDSPRERALKVLIEADMDVIVPLRRAKVKVYDQTTDHSRYVTSSSLLPDKLQMGLFGIFWLLQESHNYYIQIATGK